MREALLYEKLPGSLVRCQTCQWRCRITPGKSGVCRMYTNHDGLLFNLNYGLVSSLAVDPVEKNRSFISIRVAIVFHWEDGVVIFTVPAARTGKLPACHLRMPRVAPARYFLRQTIDMATGNASRRDCLDV